MEEWKLQTIINDFTNACEDNSREIIRAAKKLRRTYAMITVDQKVDVMEQLFPLLDSEHAHVRQIAACVILDMPIEQLCAMPPNIDIKLRNEEGAVVFSRQWTDDRPTAQQSHAWLEFVAGHKIYLEDKRARGF